MGASGKAFEQLFILHFYIQQHNLLVAEVIHQVRNFFVAPPLLIKKRIGRLIGRDYMARSPDDMFV